MATNHVHEHCGLQRTCVAAASGARCYVASHLQLLALSCLQHAESAGATIRVGCRRPSQWRRGVGCAPVGACTYRVAALAVCVGGLPDSASEVPQDLTVESFVRPNGDTADATTVQSAMESLAQAGDPTSAARTGAFGQALASGAILPGDRIVHVAGQPLLGLTPRKGLEALRSVFVPKKTEEVRGSVLGARCSMPQWMRWRL